MTGKKPLYHILALLCLLLLVLWYALPLVRTQPIGYDGAYNAQVALHYAKTGAYATTYPAELPFYKAITTGHTVLLPVALLYRWFGLSHATTAAVPLAFSCLMALAAYGLFYAVTRGSWWTPLLVLLFALLPTFWDNVIIPVGENAAIAMLLAALLCMVTAHRRKGGSGANLLWAMAGGLMALAFLTKTIAMLYIGILAIMLLLERLLFRQVPGKALLWMVVGFAVCFLVFDLFRLVQFRWSLKEWLKSWLAVFANTLRLGGHEGGIFQGLTFSAMGEKLRAIAGMTLLSHPALLLCLLVLPAGLYLARFIAALRKKTDTLQKIDAFADPMMLFSGIAGEAFLVYVLLFGAQELVIVRRLFIHLALFHVFAGYLLFQAASWVVRALRRKLSPAYLAEAAAVTVCGLVLVGTAAVNLAGVFGGRIENAGVVSPTRLLNEELTTAVEELPADAVIYTQGWWQAPEISLFADRVFTSWEPGCTADEATYFLMDAEVVPPEDWAGAPADLLGWLGSIADYETVAHFEDDAFSNPHAYSIFKIHTFYQ